MKSVVIIGANFAGLSAANQLKQHSLASEKISAKANTKVSVIDPRAEFEWTPNIHELVSGVKQLENVHLARPKLLHKLGHRFIQQQVQQLEPAAQHITLDNGDILPFDYCLIAVGLTRNNHGVEGAAQHALGFRTSQDAIAAHQALLNLVKQDRPFTVTIVGGGFTGIEVLGEILRRYRDNTNLTVRVLETGSSLLAGQPKAIEQNIRRLCASWNVDIRCNTSLKAVQPASVVLATDEELQSDLTIWTAGAQAPALIGQSELTKTDNGQIKVNAQLQSESHANVFAIGDVACMEANLAKQSYHAIDMGMIAGKNIKRLLSNQSMGKYTPAEKPILLAFGDLNTYLIQQNTVLASPLLATAKELVYQLYMTQLSCTLPLQDFSDGLISRFMGTINQLLLPELSRLKLLNVLRQSKVLQWGGVGDIEQFYRAMFISLTRGC